MAAPACSGAPSLGRAVRVGLPAPRGATASVTHGHRACPRISGAQVIAEVNAVRRKSRLKPLATDARLARVARDRAAAMAASGRLSHRGWKRALRQGGVDGHLLGENVAYNYSSAAAVMRTWLDSRGHRANILNPRFRRVGVGCVIDARERYWWVQDFAG